MVEVSSFCDTSFMPIVLLIYIHPLFQPHLYTWQYIQSKRSKQSKQVQQTQVVNHLPVKIYWILMNGGEL